MAPSCTYRALGCCVGLAFIVTLATTSAQSSVYTLTNNFRDNGPDQGNSFNFTLLSGSCGQPTLALFPSMTILRTVGAWKIFTPPGALVGVGLDNGRQGDNYFFTFLDWEGACTTGVLRYPCQCKLIWDDCGDSSPMWCTAIASCTVSITTGYTSCVGTYNATANYNS